MKRSIRTHGSRRRGVKLLWIVFFVLQSNSLALFFSSSLLTHPQEWLEWGERASRVLCITQSSKTISWHLSLPSASWPLQVQIDSITLPNKLNHRAHDAKMMMILNAHASLPFLYHRQYQNPPPHDFNGSRSWVSSFCSCYCCLLTQQKCPMSSFTSLPTYRRHLQGSFRSKSCRVGVIPILITMLERRQFASALLSLTILFCNADAKAWRGSNDAAIYRPKPVSLVEPALAGSQDSFKTPFSSPSTSSTTLSLLDVVERTNAAFLATTINAVAYHQAQLAFPNHLVYSATVEAFVANPTLAYTTGTSALVVMAGVSYYKHQTCVNVSTMSPLC